MSTIKVDAINATGGTTGMALASNGIVTIQGEGTATTNLQQGLAKCWAWVDHKTDNAIDNGFNTASLTDTSAGISSVNITNAMESASQVTQVTSYQSGTAQITGNAGASMTSTTACKFVTNDTGSTGQEDTEYGMTLHGDLA